MNDAVDRYREQFRDEHARRADPYRPLIEPDRQIFDAIMAAQPHVRTTAEMIDAGRAAAADWADAHSGVAPTFADAWAGLSAGRGEPDWAAVIARHLARVATGATASEGEG